MQRQQQLQRQRVQVVKVRVLTPTVPLAVLMLQMTLFLSNISSSPNCYCSAFTTISKTNPISIHCQKNNIINPNHSNSNSGSYSYSNTHINSNSNTIRIGNINYYNYNNNNRHHHDQQHHLQMIGRTARGILARGTSATTTTIPNPTGTIAQIKTVIAAMATASSGGSGAFHSVKLLLLNTSPSIYFTTLILAGAGLPISEDALCIFIGSVLPMIWNENPVLRTKFIAALYFGIVLSDILTFSIGRVMGNGLLAPIQNRLNLRSDRIDFCEGDDDEEEEEEEDEEEEEEMTEEELEQYLLDTNGGEESLELEFCEIPTDDLRSKDRALAILEAVGNYAGFVIRLCMGMRLPMMLAAGFSKKVSYVNFIIGTAFGASVSLSIQLLIGFVLRNNPTLIIAFVASISTFPILIPTLVGFVGWINIMYKRWSMYRPQQTSS